MKNKLLKQARQRCQLSIEDVERLFGVYDHRIRSVERGKPLFDKATYSRLWKFYKRYERDNNVDEVGKSVVELWNEWGQG